MTKINKLDEACSPPQAPQASRRGQATNTPSAADTFASGPASPAESPSHAGCFAFATGPLPAAPRKRSRVAREDSPSLQRIHLIGSPRLDSHTPLVVRDVTLPSGKHLFVDAGKIACGSYGHVFQAVDEFGEMHAVKDNVSTGKPSPTRTRVTRPLARIEHEQAMVQRFCGPSEIYRTERVICYTMPWYPASLDLFIDELSLADRRTLAPAMLHELLGLLSTMHAQQVAHGDIKPDNFLLSPQGKLHLGDLGCSGSFVAHGHTEPGDFNRLAPEQRGLGESVQLNAQTDMWAAGIIIWEFATGTHNPFQGASEDYVDWHQRQPRDPEGRIDVAQTPREGAWGIRVRELEEGTASQASMPGLASVLVNDLNHPNPAQRADAAKLLQRLPATWSAVVPTLQARLVELLLNTTIAQRGTRLRAWWSERNTTVSAVDPEAGYITP